MIAIHRPLMTLFGAACLATLASSAPAAVLLSDEMNSGAGWGVNASNADTAATFGYDYSADGIAEAPNSQVGDAATTGLKLEANIAGVMGSVQTVYPIAGNFAGTYQMRFDAWMNYDADERINGGSAGTTEFIGGGIGYDNVASDIGPGAQMLATGDGGSGSDWRVFENGAFKAPGEMTALDRNGFNAHYSDYLTGVAPPAGQVAQVSFPPGTAGSPGFQWITVQFSVLNELGRNEVIIDIIKPGLDPLEIIHLDCADASPCTTDGNIGLIYADFFSSVTTRPDLTFGLIDNVFVTDMFDALLLSMRS